MTIYFQEDFESGSNGAAITTSNTTFSLVNGAPTFTNSPVRSKLLAMSVNTSTAALASGKCPLGALRTSVYNRFYIMSTGAWSASAIFASQMLSGSTNRADLRITAGVCSLRNSAVAVFTSAKTLLPNTWYCLEWHLDSVGALQTLTIYDIAGNIIEASGNQTYTSGNTFDTANVGSCTSLASIALTVDAIVIADASVGPIPLIKTPAVISQNNGFF